MPMKCSIVGCKTNYASELQFQSDDVKHGIFAFPNDPVRRDLWLSLIPNKNMILTKNTRICSKHFLDKFVIKRLSLKSKKNGAVQRKERYFYHLTKDAYPTIFINPKTMTEKREEREQFDIQPKIESRVSKNAVSDFSSFCQEAESYLGGDRWLVELSKKGDYTECIQFCFLQEMFEAGDPKPLFTVTVFPDMHVKVHSDISGDVPDSCLSGIFGEGSPPTIYYWSQFVNLITQLSCSTGIWINGSDHNQIFSLNDRSLHISSEATSTTDESSIVADQSLIKRLRDEKDHLFQKLHKVIFQRNQLVKMIEYIHHLASINLDILSMFKIPDGNSVAKEEMRKVYKLVDTIMNDLQEITSDPMHFPVVPDITQESTNHLTLSSSQKLEFPLSPVNSTLTDDQMRLNACDYGEMNDGCQENDADEHPLCENSLYTEEQTKKPEERMCDNAMKSPLKKGKRNVVCEVCGKKYFTQCSLQNHKRISHREMFPVSYSCPICSKKFISRKKLNNHVEIHSDDKTHQCYVCGVFVKYKTSLNKHIRAHNKEKLIEKGFKGNSNSTNQEKACEIDKQPII